MPKNDGNNRLIDLAAERAVLGGALTDPAWLMQFYQDLQPEDFHDEGHAKLFETVQEMYRVGDPVDVTLVIRRLGADLNKLGVNGTRGAAYVLGPIMDDVYKMGATVRAPHWAKVVKRLATLRGMVRAAQDIARLAYNTETAALDDVFAEADRIFRQAFPKITEEWLLTWEKSIGAFYDYQLERQQDASDVEEGLVSARPTVPWVDMRQFVPWLREGQMLVIGAEPGVGKTVCMENMAEHWAQIGLRTTFFHLELSTKTMLDRRMARWSGVPFREIELGAINEQTDAASRIFKGWPGGIDYVHCPGWSAARVAAVARQQAKEGRCDVVIVDYAQKLRLSYAHGQTTAQAAGAGAETLKILAESAERPNGLIGIPLVVGSQLNRKSRDRLFKGPQDIRDSGEWEDKCNVFMSLDRPVVPKDELGPGGVVVFPAGTRTPETHARIAKNTLGKEGRFDLMLEGDRFRFRDISHETEPLNF